MNVSAARLAVVLSGSFRMLADRPSLFFPKIFSAVLSSIWLLLILEQGFSTILYLVSVPLFIFLGLAVSVLVAAMVRDETSLLGGIISVRASLTDLLKASLFLILLILLISLPVSAGIYMYIATGSVPILYASLLITFLALTALVFLLYFFPVALLDSNSFTEGFRRSSRKSISNSVEVMFLTFLSFLLLGIAFLSTGFLETLGYAGFIGGRMVSSVVTTYFYVASPNYYEITP